MHSLRQPCVAPLRRQILPTPGSVCVNPFRGGKRQTRLDNLVLWGPAPEPLRAVNAAL